MCCGNALGGHHTKGIGLEVSDQRAVEPLGPQGRAQVAMHDAWMKAVMAQVATPCFVALNACIPGLSSFKAYRDLALAPRHDACRRETQAPRSTNPQPPWFRGVYGPGPDALCQARPSKDAYATAGAKTPDMYCKRVERVVFMRQQPQHAGECSSCCGSVQAVRHRTCTERSKSLPLDGCGSRRCCCGGVRPAGSKVCRRWVIAWLTLSERHVTLRSTEEQPRLPFQQAQGAWHHQVAGSMC